MTANLVLELRENFAAQIPGFRTVKGIPDDCPAWTLIANGEYGVAIPNPKRLIIHETFAHVSIESQTYVFDNEPKDMLVLLCSSYALRLEFAAICAQFVEEGPNNSNRDRIQTDPFLWWKQWRELLGNKISDREAYSVIAEMLVLDYFLAQGADAIWGGPYAGSHDIDTDQNAIEVKSTLQKYSTTVTISSQNQLVSEKPLWLYFVRMEVGHNDGISVDTMAARLVSYGYDAVRLEEQLIGLGFGVGTNSRMMQYRILEKRRYFVGRDFPRITNDSFKNGRLPDLIIHIEYTVDLEGLQYEIW